MHILGYGVETSANGGGSYMPYDTDGQPMTDEALENINRLNRNLKLYRALEEMNSSHISRGLRTVFSDRPDQNLRVFGIYEITGKNCTPKVRSKKLPESPRQEGDEEGEQLELYQISLKVADATQRSLSDETLQPTLAQLNLLQQFSFFYYLNTFAPTTEEDIANNAFVLQYGRNVQFIDENGAPSYIVQYENRFYTMRSNGNDITPLTPESLEQIRAEFVLPLEVAEPAFPFAVTPYDYRLEDTEDGWQKGTVQLSFANRTTNVIPTAHMEENIRFPNGLTVETAEGVSYPAQIMGEIYNPDGTHSTYNNSWAPLAEAQPWTPINELDFSRPWVVPIPPGFQVNSFITWGAWSTRYRIEWQSAAAAHPTRIVFNDYPELSFNLNDSRDTLPHSLFFQSPVESFANSAGTVWTEEEGGIRVVLTGRCGNNAYLTPNIPAIDYNDRLLLEVYIQNQDLFYQRESAFDFPVSVFFYDASRDWVNGAAWFSSGNFSPMAGYSDETDIISLGPGQTQVGYVDLSWSIGYGIYPSFVVLWGVDGHDYKIYNLRECVVRQ